jgi:hypothetical protein
MKSEIVTAALVEIEIAILGQRNPGENGKLDFSPRRRRAAENEKENRRHSSGAQQKGG